MSQNTAKQNYPGLVASYDTRPGNKVGLVYNASGPTRGKQRGPASAEGRKGDGEG